MSDVIQKVVLRPTLSSPIIVKSTMGVPGGPGPAGPSAYDVAVSNGFVGTETAWLASLVGPPGDPGPTGESAYEAAVANGFSGTEADWLASLHGADGASAYEVAVANGFVGTQAEWIASLYQGTLDTDPTLAADSDTRVPSQHAIKSYVDAGIAIASGSGGSGALPDGVAGGCGVTYSGSGLTFNMSAGSFVIDGTPYTATAQSVTLAAADATNARIDVLYIDSTGTFGKVTGTPAASPSQPSIDPTTQLYLTFVLVPAAATDLNSGITNESIYAEGTEWTWSTSGTGFTLNSTNNPHSGTKCIEGTNVASAAYAKGVRSTPMSFDGDGNLVLYIRSKASWAKGRWLTLQWFLGGVAKGAAVSLKSGTFGYDSTSTAAYQLIVISKALFTIPAGIKVDELRIADAGGAIGFYLDDVSLQNTGSVSGGGSTSGITQAQADARYTKRLSVSNVSATSFTVSSADVGAHRRFTANSAVALHINSGHGYEVGDRTRFTEVGTGQVTISGGTGITLNAAGGALKSRMQFSVFEIECVGTNEFDVLGDLIP